MKFRDRLAVSGISQRQTICGPLRDAVPSPSREVIRATLLRGRSRTSLLTSIQETLQKHFMLVHCGRRGRYRRFFALPVDSRPLRAASLFGKNGPAVGHSQRTECKLCRLLSCKCRRSKTHWPLCIYSSDLRGSSGCSTRPQHLGSCLALQTPLQVRAFCVRTNRRRLRLRRLFIHARPAKCSGASGDSSDTPECNILSQRFHSCSSKFKPFCTHHTLLFVRTYKPHIRHRLPTL